MGSINYNSSHSSSQSKSTDQWVFCDECEFHVKLSECKVIIPTGIFRSKKPRMVCKSCYREYKINQIIKN